MTLNKLVETFMELPEDDREDFALTLGIALGGFFLKRNLRKKGAEKWQADVAVSVISSLVLINKRLERIAKRTKGAA